MKKKKKINFIPKAINDIEKTKKWYNEQKEGLGKEFINEVEKTIDNIGDKVGLKL